MNSAPEDDMKPCGQSAAAKMNKKEKKKKTVGPLEYSDTVTHARWEDLNN